MRIEDTILSSLLMSEEYARKVIPHIDKAYFGERVDALLYDEISAFFVKYNKLPNKEAVKIQVTDRSGVTNSDLESAIENLDNFSSAPQNLEWLVEKTEAFCRDRALYNAIMESITIIDGKDSNLNREAIPNILQKALGISFSTAVGHSYLDDAEARWEFYTRVDAKIKFDIDMLNTITDGGLTRKSLTMLLAVSGGGKSLVMSHMAAGNLREGYNVLYISMEMSEEKIAERIDANLMNIDIDKIKVIGKDSFVTKVSNIAAKTQGRLFVKEYPPNGAHAGHFRGLLDELKVKQNFIPDVIYVDYLGITASARMKMGGSVNSYTYLKSVAEELRALAVEFDIPVVTAGQVNRGAYGTSDIDLADTSDSMGIIHSLDLALGIVRTEELDMANQVMFVQLKNRYADPAMHKRFVVGLDRPKMKLYNIESPTAGFHPQAQAQGKTYAPPTLPKIADTSFTPVIKSNIDTSGFTFNE